MKAYGLEKSEYPSIHIIAREARNSHTGKLRGKGGDYRGYCYGADKARVRRYWKRRARAEGKAECSERE